MNYESKTKVEIKLTLFCQGGFMAVNHSLRVKLKLLQYKPPYAVCKLRYGPDSVKQSSWSYFINIEENDCLKKDSNYKF